MREISAGLIIYKKEKDRSGKTEIKYLLLYHGNGYWNFPKGKLEQGEISIQTALREVTEETGIPVQSLKIERNFKITDKYFYWRERKNIFKIVIFYLAKAENPQVKISYEHEGYGWFLHRDAQKLLKHQNSKEMLKKANDFLKRKNSPANTGFAKQPQST